MRRTTARALASALQARTRRQAAYEITVISAAREKARFRWVNPRRMLAVRVQGLATGERRSEPLVLFIGEWRTSRPGDHYLIVFGEHHAGSPYLEFHHEAERPERGPALLWSYRPSKRDGRNAERKERFAALPKGHSELALPLSGDDVDRFLEDLDDLVRLRLIADDLDARIDGDVTFPEGRRAERIHLARERSRALLDLAKRRRLKQTGRLNCQACGFDFETRYGSHGAGFIEAHHMIPVSSLDDEAETRVEDIALVCANCHRMLHRRRPWLEMNQLRLLLDPNARPE